MRIPFHTDNVDYDEGFYQANNRYSSTTPEQVFSILFRYFDIESVCDVGGGAGVWIGNFLKIKGVKEEDDADVLCIDGDYIKEDMLQMPSKYFRTANLEERIDLEGRRFDLAMTLEVAEHLSPKRADSFVEDLTRLSDVVLFSAAIEGQGGIHHVNEQYMPYWVEKFGNHGYRPFDLIRPEIQFCTDIPWYYRQNMIVFVNEKSEYYDLLVNKYHAYPPLQRMVSIECFEGSFKLMKRLRSSKLNVIFSKLTRKKDLPK